MFDSGHVIFGKGTKICLRKKSSALLKMTKFKKKEKIDNLMTVATRFIYP